MKIFDIGVFEACDNDIITPEDLCEEEDNVAEIQLKMVALNINYLI